MPSLSPRANRPSSRPYTRRLPLFSSLTDTDATLVLREDGVIDHVSAAARRLLNLGTRPLTGESVFRHVPSEAAGRLARALSALSARDDGHATGLLQLKTGLGPWQWFKVEMTPRRPYEDTSGVILRLHQRGRE